MVSGGRDKQRGGHTKGGTRSAPKFTHLPAQRAQKLREEWLAKQKIKNAYSMQKRKGGLIPTGSNAEVPHVTVDNDAPASEVDSESETELELPAPSTSTPSTSKHTPKSRAPQTKPSSPSTRTPPTSRPPHASTSTQDHSIHPARLKRKAKQAAQTSAPAEEQNERLRALVKDAYSPASLHTFKADPLKKRKVQVQSSSPYPAAGRGRGDAEVGRGRERGAGRGRGTTGRGQPDMRKRMGALLAQIEAQK